MSLGEELRARIAREGPIRVRDFMAVALARYYGAGPDIGAGGDFYTASNVSLFAPALARFVEAAKARVGPDARVVEIGGGTGAVAKAIGADVVVEPSAGLAASQAAHGLRVERTLADLAPGPSVFLANEVLDALPVHRVRMTEDGLRELYVTWDGARFAEVEGPLTVAVDAELEPGDVVEVCPDAGALLDALAAAAPTFVALFLDYAAGPPRPGGTLRGFHRHRVTDAFERPGEQDITADVDFAGVAAMARDRGLDVLGERAQGEFLADLGLVDDMMAALARGDHDAYAAAKGLLLPGGMGERFRVLCVARGVAVEPRLPGFRPLTPGGPA